MTMSDVDQGPSDDELFNEAVSDETPDSPVVSEQTEQPARDEAGRFAKKEEPETAEVVAEVQAEKPVVDDNASQVPSWRVREINEEKRALAAERDALLAERTSWQQRQQQVQPQVQQPVERPAKPDPLLDPDGYAKSVRDEIREEILSERREESLQRAAEAHPDEFKEAYTAAQKAVDPALKARMQSSRDPGKTLLEWHRENKVKAEVGHDPNAWLEKKLEERLNDPAFLQKAIERSKGASQQADGRPRVDLPPSLNGASRSNAALKSSNDDVSDDELFDKLAG
jgi:hypothetical protein